MDNKKPQSKAPNTQQKQPQQPFSKAPQSQPGKAAPAQQKKPGAGW